MLKKFDFFFFILQREKMLKKEIKKLIYIYRYIYIVRLWTITSNKLRGEPAFKYIYNNTEGCEASSDSGMLPSISSIDAIDRVSTNW
jgi:hypothetical protein